MIFIPAKVQIINVFVIWDTLVLIVVLIVIAMDIQLAKNSDLEYAMIAKITRKGNFVICVQKAVLGMPLHYKVCVRCVRVNGIKMSLWDIFALHHIHKIG